MSWKENKVRWAARPLEEENRILAEKRPDVQDLLLLGQAVIKAPPLQSSQQQHALPPPPQSHHPLSHPRYHHPLPQTAPAPPIRLSTQPPAPVQLPTLPLPPQPRHQPPQQPQQQPLVKIEAVTVTSCRQAFPPHATSPPSSSSRSPESTTLLRTVPLSSRPPLSPETAAMPPPPPPPPPRTPMSPTAGVSSTSGEGSFAALNGNDRADIGRGKEI